MARRTSDLCFCSCIIDLCRTACLHSDKSWIYITNCCLLCTKTSANTRLLHANTTLWNAKRIGKNTSCMEYYVKSAITVKTCIADKWLHHCLIICLHMISMINGDITVCHNAFYITIKVTSACDKISLVITSDRTRRKPVLF